MSEMRKINATQLNLRAVIAAMMSAFAIMILFMSFSGGFGLWKFEFTELSRFRTGFWIWAAVSWIVSVYIAGYIASVGSKATSQRDGIIHGVVAWAFSCAFGCLFIISTMTHLLITEVTPVMFWTLFIGNFFALIASVFGGMQGVESKRAKIAMDMPQNIFTISKLHKTHFKNKRSHELSA